MKQSKYKTLAATKQEFIKKYCIDNCEEMSKDIDNIINKAQNEKHTTPLGFYTFNFGKNEI